MKDTQISRISVALAVLSLVAVACAYVFVRAGSAPTGKVAAAKPQPEALSPLRESAPIALSDPALLPTTAPDLGEQVARLSVSIDRLEKVVAELNARISRSKLAVPSRAEVEASLVKMRPEMAKYQEAIRAALAEARAIAAAENVKFNENAFLDLNSEIPLPRNSRYLTVRASAIQAHRILASLEVMFAQKRFEAMGLPEQ